VIQRSEHNGAASVFPASLVCDGWCLSGFGVGDNGVLRGELGGVSKGRRDGGFLCIGTLGVGIVRRDGLCVVFPRRGTRVARGVGKKEKGKPSARSGGRELEPSQRIGLSATLAVPQLGDEEIDVEREVLSHPFLPSQSRPTFVARAPRHGTRLVEDEDADRMQQRCGPAARQQQHQPSRPNQPPTPLQTHSRRRRETTRAMSRSRTRSPASETV
jgi:hypothetical protein